MTQTATTPRLRIGPPPDGYESGPVTVLYKPDGDDRPADDLKTLDSLADAQAFADVCVERGFLAGDLEFRADTGGPSALQHQVDAEQADHDAATAAESAPAPETAPEKPKRTRKPKANTDLEPTLAIVYINKRDEEKVDFEGPEAKAREKFTATPTPGVGRMELRDAQGAVLDTKAPHLASVDDRPDPTPEELEALGVSRRVQDAVAGGEADEDVPPEIPEEGGITGPLDIPPDQPAPEPAEEDVADDTPEGDPPAGVADAAEVYGGVAPETITTNSTATVAPEGPEEPDGQKTLVDRNDYESEALQLPKIDGQQIDRIAFAFTGSIMLDRADPADVKLWRALTLGKDVTLQIEGACAGYSGKGATNRDGDLDVVIGVRRIKIHTIYMPVTDDEAA